ncbi:MAG: FAD-dependent oxidoreductase, partial [Bacteroidota bacterium]
SMHVVIVGNGIAGVTAARVVRKRQPDWRITLVSDEHPEHLARTAWMYIYMGHLALAHTRPYETRFWEENRIERVHDRVLRLGTEAGTLTLRDEGTLAFDRLLLATGSVPAFFGWLGQDLEGVQGLYHLQDLRAMERDAASVREAVVIGGGLIGVEMAEMLHTRGTAVTYLVRESRYFEHAVPERESRILEAEIRRHGVDLRLSTEAGAFLGTDRVEAVETTDGERLPAGWVGVATGVRPNVAWLEGSGIETDRGVLVNRQLQTNVPTVWAAGDCAQHRVPPPGRRAVEPLWYTGRIQGATVGLGLAGEPRDYAPGVFFNSAKFFDIEWQVVGQIAPEPSPQVTEAVAEDETRAGPRLVRLQADAATGALLGIHALNVRLRQEVCTEWIERGVRLDDALRDLRRAQFDGEFSRPLPIPTPA